MKYSDKVNILIDLYLHGQIDKEDYIRIRKSIEPITIKLHAAIKEQRKEQ